MAGSKGPAILCDLNAGRPQRSAPYVVIEVLTYIATGFVWTYALWLTPCALRLLFCIIITTLALASGGLFQFTEHLRMAFQPVKGANESIDRVMWKLFVWGKYLAVAALEANMCIARLTLGWIDPSSILSAAVCTWIPHTILAFNIWECVVLEARIAWRYGGSLYSSAAWLNVVNGSVLTITTMLQAAAHACSVSAGAFHFNHPLTYSLAYLTWNAKFASVAQDNAMLSHVGHSRFIAMLWSVLYGTDYMELRVGALLIHFSVGFVCAGPQDEKLPDWIYKTGFGTFHQLFQGPRFDVGLSAVCAFFTAVCTLDVTKELGLLDHVRASAASTLVWFVCVPALAIYFSQTLTERSH